MTLVKIPDRETGGWEIDGEEIAHVSTRFGDPEQKRADARPRWGDNYVWRLAPGPAGPRYALYRASMSVVYHTAGTSCRVTGSGGRGTGAQMGSPAAVKDLPDDAEPCWICEPPYPEDLAEGDSIRFEFPRQTLEICDGADQVIRRLTRYRRHTGQELTGASGPARELIAQCREHDPGNFGAPDLPMQRIS